MQYTEAYSAHQTYGLQMSPYLFSFWACLGVASSGQLLLLLEPKVRHLAQPEAASLLTCCKIEFVDSARAGMQHCQAAHCGKGHHTCTSRASPATLSQRHCRFAAQGHDIQTCMALLGHTESNHCSASACSISEMMCQVIGAKACCSCHTLHASTGLLICGPHQRHLVRPIQRQQLCSAAPARQHRSRNRRVVRHSHGGVLQLWSCHGGRQPRLDSGHGHRGHGHGGFGHHQDARGPSMVCMLALRCSAARSG
jgi:hypothetical protein